MIKRNFRIDANLTTVVPNIIPAIHIYILDTDLSYLYKIIGNKKYPAHRFLAEYYGIQKSTATRMNLLYIYSTYLCFLSKIPFNEWNTSVVFYPPYFMNYLNSTTNESSKLARSSHVWKIAFIYSVAFTVLSKDSKYESRINKPIEAKTVSIGMPKTPLLQIPDWVGYMHYGQPILLPRKNKHV